MKGKQYLILALVFALGFAAAVVLIRPPAAGAAAPSPAAGAIPATVIRADGLGSFFQAVKRGDFAAMAELGERAFVRGSRVENAGAVLSGYETNSFPPFTVYALFVENTTDKTRRVLLTLDKDDKVESFLAEEMSIIK